MGLNLSEVLIKLWVEQGHLWLHILVQDQGEYRKHGVDSRITTHKVKKKRKKWEMKRGEATKLKVIWSNTVEACIRVMLLWSCPYTGPMRLQVLTRPWGNPGTEAQRQSRRWRRRRPEDRTQNWCHKVTKSEILMPLRWRICHFILPAKQVSWWTH